MTSRSSGAACRLLATVEGPRPVPSCAHATGVRLAVCPSGLALSLYRVSANRLPRAEPLRALAVGAPRNDALRAGRSHRSRSGRTRRGRSPGRRRRRRHCACANGIWARGSSMAWLKRRLKKPHWCAHRRSRGPVVVRLSQWGAMSLAWVPPLRIGRIGRPIRRLPDQVEGFFPRPSGQDEGGKALRGGCVGRMRSLEVARRGMPWRLFTLSRAIIAVRDLASARRRPSRNRRAKCPS
jgi:hypothetical protein